MSLKALAFTVKQCLQAAGGAPVVQSHAYELLAAALGFGSYAALTATHVLVVSADWADCSAESLALLERRLRELGYADASAKMGESLLAYIKERNLAALTPDEVVEALQEDPFELLGVEAAADLQVLIDGLSRLAEKRNPSAHYALAHINRGNLDADDHQPGLSGEYWLGQLQAGAVLDGIRLEWALAAQTAQQRKTQWSSHLGQAAALGHAGAIVELAEMGGDRHLLDQALAIDSADDPLRLAELAYEHDRLDDARRWYYVAAAQGDTDAMRMLIEELEPQNLLQGWVWIYLAEELGDDLREDRMRAYHDGGAHDGEEYDDDIGGPLYVGGEEGLSLPALDPAADEQARRLAKEIFAQL
ncbi:hypothetical protein FQZ97_797650 [compost metagenome]